MKKWVKTFESFRKMNEAFLPKDKEAAIKQITAYLENNTKLKLYPYGEIFDIKKGDESFEGELFLSLQSEKAIRFNWINGDTRSEIHSIDLWSSFEFDVNPDFTLELNNNSVIQALKQILEFYLNPQGMINGGSTQNVEELEEEGVLAEKKINEADALEQSLEDAEKRMKRLKNPESRAKQQELIDEIKAKMADPESATTDGIEQGKKLRNSDPVMDVFRAIELNTIQVARGKSNSLIITGQAGIGKCHGIGTKILMHDGSIKNVEDVEIGDVIMGDDSTPRNVLSLGRGKDMIYKIKGNYGFDEFTCNSEHILTLKHTVTKNIINIPLNEYLNKSDGYKRNYKLFKKPVSFNETYVKIDPYFIGAWLGDGSRMRPQIETMDTEIVSYLKTVADSYGLNLTKVINTESKSDGYAITAGNCSDKGRFKNPLISDMKYYGLYRPDEKFIPTEYLVNSRENRLKLLAGLIDTDGYTNQVGKSYLICTKYSKLADQINYLCRSLGFKSHITNKEISNINNKEGNDKTYFNINISGDLSEVPVKLERKKLIEPRKQIKDVLVSGFTVTEVGYNDYYGFTLDNNHLYLLGDFTVTHNTNTVVETLKSVGMHSGNAYYKATGDISTAGLYEILFKYRHRLILFDDCDGVFRDPESVNMLKGALDTYDKRDISNIKKGHNYYDPEDMTDIDMDIKWENDKKLPTQFVFDGQVIFVSNLPEEKFDKALISRSLHVDVNLDKEQIISRMRDIMKKMLPGVAMDKKEEAFDFLVFVTNNYPTKFDLNIRTLIHAINLRSNPENEPLESIGGVSEPVWKWLIRQYLIKTR